MNWLNTGTANPPPKEGRIFVPILVHTQTAKIVAKTLARNIPKMHLRPRFCMPRTPLRSVQCSIPDPVSSFFGRRRKVRERKEEGRNMKKEGGCEGKRKGRRDMKKGKKREKEIGEGKGAERPLTSCAPGLPLNLGYASGQVSPRGACALVSRSKVDIE